MHCNVSLFSLLLALPPSSTLFPYTTLFRSLPLVTLRQALVESRNSATIRLAAELDLDEVVSLAHRAGLRSVTEHPDRKSTRLNSSHLVISYAVFCLKKKHHKY